MKSLTRRLLIEAAPIICAVAAFALAGYSKPGWGWFLVATVAMTCNPCRESHQ